MVLCTACLFIAATPAKHITTEKMISETSKPSLWIFHTFHKVVLGSDDNSYYVTLDFNLSTQVFGVISAHNVLYPSNELAVTKLSGAGTTVFGNGSTILVYEELALRVHTTLVTFVIPEDTYTIDY